MRRLLHILALSTVVLLGLLSPLAAQTGTIRGQVVTSAGDPAPAAHVHIVTLGRAVEAGPDGRFIFERVPVGAYLVEAESVVGAGSLQRVQVTAGGTTEVVLALDPLYHMEALVVTAGPEALRTSELYQAAGVLGGRELARKAQPTLGETLAGEPGVSSTYFGPGASRPLIRGLGGDRVRILESGVGVGDASNTSPDHAVSIDPGSASQIEVVRGPATLLYGSSAIGGVVNVVDERIPTEVGGARVRGHVQALGGTVADERSLSGEAGGHTGPLAFNIRGEHRTTGDYSIPGFAEIAPDPGEESGILENSAIETTSGALGASLVGEQGYFGIAVGRYDSRYGVPGHHHEDAGAEPTPSAEEGSVQIDLNQRRLDMGGSLRTAHTIEHLRARFGLSDYEHAELEGGAVGTRFLNNQWEGRLEAHHREFGPSKGALGLQFSSRDFEAVGEEAFVPRSETTQLGLFAFEELDLEAARIQLGARFERQVSTERANDTDRSHSGLSVSAGLNVPVGERLTLALATSRSIKLPTPEELYSNGPHLATDSYEVGDPTLGTESALSVDASARLTVGRVQGSVTGYVNRFSDFIYASFTGQEQDGLQEVRYTQADAIHLGFEVDGNVEVYHVGARHAALRFGADYVRATLRDTEEPLPRIPPPSLRGGVEFDAGRLRADLDVRRALRQDRVASFETETAGYTLAGGSVSYRFIQGAVAHDVTLTGRNLTDAEARPHTSLLKDAAPMPGRELRLAYRLSF